MGGWCVGFEEWAATGKSAVLEARLDIHPESINRYPGARDFFT